MAVTHATNGSGTESGDGNVSKTAWEEDHEGTNVHDHTDADSGGTLTPAAHNHSGADITSGTVVDARLDAAIARDSEVTSAISTHAGLSDPHPGYLTPTEGDAAYQPKDTDLTAIAALSTTSYGRAILELANQAALAALLPGLNSLPVATGDVDINTHKLTNVVDPTSNQHGATKKYVDDQVSALVAGGAMTVEEVDASPTVTASKLVLPNGTLGVVGSVATYTPAGTSFGTPANTYGTPAAGAASTAIRTDAVLPLPPGTVLALQNYVRGTDGGVGVITGTTLTDLDATNAAVTFTAPASGNVLVECEGLFDVSSTHQALWGLREASSTVAGPFIVGVSDTNAQRGRMSFVITGVSAGSHTYKLAAKTNNAGGTTTLYGGPSFGSVVLKVMALA